MARYQQRKAKSSSHEETMIRVKTAAVAFGATLLAYFAGAEIIACWRPSDETIAAGSEIFLHEWSPDDALAAGGDGLGPVFNAKSCVACHFQGGVGGGGSNEHNVRSFEALPTRNRAEVVAGVVHASAVTLGLLETSERIAEMFPTVREQVPGGCGPVEVDFNPVHFASVNTPALFGDGLIDRISDGAIRRNHHLHMLSNVGSDLQLDFQAARVGRIRELPNGRVGKFGWKAQFATVEDFVAAACAVEVGLTNPKRSQDVPGEHVADVNAALDLNGDQFYSLVSFVGTLSRPEQRLPESEEERSYVKYGETLFGEIGCADCHTPNLGSVTGLYSDLLLHVVETGTGQRDPYGDQGSLPDLLPESHPKPNEWKTPPLWGVADTAPYFHDGGSATLEDAIMRHQGDAKGVTTRFDRLKEPEKEQLIAFLKTLRAPSSAAPAPTPVATSEEIAQTDAAE